MRYIGSKANLLHEIRSVVESQASGSRVFCDLFAGTGVVGREFKTSHKVISNDILYFAYVLNAAHNGLPEQPDFKTLSKKIGKDPIDYLNEISVSEADLQPSDFMALSYSPAGESGRMYLSIENAMKIDRIRQKIDHWHESGYISREESYYFLASLIEEVPSVSNTTGTYGAFLKHWDKRALKPIKLQHLQIAQSSNVNQIFNSDANELIHHISGDVLYLDTPYNGRQYSSNYHLLESLAKYDQPDLKGLTGTRVDKSGESSYCRKSSVYDSFDYLLENSRFSTTIISYSSDGLLSEEQLIELVTKHGDISTLNFRKIPYRRYKRTLNDERNVLEYLIAISK